MNKIVISISLAIAGLCALSDAPAAQRQLPGGLGGLLPPTLCNTFFCNPADHKCWGPALTHCQAVTEYPLIQDAEGHWQLGKPTQSCEDFPCVGIWVNW